MPVMKKRAADLNAAELDALAREAWSQAAEASLAQGLPVTYGEGGEIIRLLPDGRREVVAAAGHTVPKVRIKTARG
jgi:hypothetical protein